MRVNLNLMLWAGSDNKRGGGAGKGIIMVWIPLTYVTPLLHNLIILLSPPQPPGWMVRKLPLMK